MITFSRVNQRLKKRPIRDRLDRDDSFLTMCIINIIVLIMVLSPQRVSTAILYEPQVIEYYVDQMVETLDTRYIGKLPALDVLKETAYEAMGTNPTRMYKNAMNALAELLDSYSIYMDPSDFSDYKAVNAAKPYSLGVRVRTRLNYPEVIYVADKSPAQKAGIKVGDVLLSVNARSMYRKTASYVESVLREDNMRTVNIQVLRGDTKRWFFNIRQKKIKTPTVFLVDLEDSLYSGSLFELGITPEELSSLNAGCIRLMSFPDGVSGQMSKLVQKLKNNGVKTLILDIRDNPGGLIREMASISKQLAPEGVMFYTRRKGGEMSATASVNKNPPFEHIIVLTNQNTISAAEVLAAVLQDSGIATVVGLHTYMKGVGQDYFDTPGGGAFRLSTVEIYRKDGSPIDGVGVWPDITSGALANINASVVLADNKDNGEYITELLKMQKALQTFGCYLSINHGLLTVENPNPTLDDIYSHGLVGAIKTFRKALGIGVVNSDREYMDAKFIDRLNLAINEYNAYYDITLFEAVKLVLSMQ